MQDQMWEAKVWRQFTNPAALILSHTLPLEALPCLKSMMLLPSDASPSGTFTIWY